MMEWSDAVLKFAKAIAHAEGFGIDGAIPTRGNNPGDLTGTDSGSFPTVEVMNQEGVVHFVNLEDGWNALYHKVDRMLSGRSHVYPLTLTLEQVGLKYSGGKPEWAVNVAAYLGVSVTTTIAELAKG